jgi:hypothetical protein
MVLDHDAAKKKHGGGLSIASQTTCPQSAMFQKKLWHWGGKVEAGRRLVGKGAHASQPLLESCFPSHPVEPPCCPDSRIHEASCTLYGVLSTSYSTVRDELPCQVVSTHVTKCRKDVGHHHALLSEPAALAQVASSPSNIEWPS